MRRSKYTRLFFFAGIITIAAIFVLLGRNLDNEPIGGFFNIEESESIENPASIHFDFLFPFKNEKEWYNLVTGVMFFSEKSIGTYPLFEIKFGNQNLHVCANEVPRYNSSTMTWISIILITLIIILSTVRKDNNECRMPCIFRFMVFYSTFIILSVALSYFLIEGLWIVPIFLVHAVLALPYVIITDIAHCSTWNNAFFKTAASISIIVIYVMITQTSGFLVFSPQWLLICTLPSATVLLSLRKQIIVLIAYYVSIAGWAITCTNYLDLGQNRMNYSMIKLSIIFALSILLSRVINNYYRRKRSTLSPINHQ